MAKQKIKKFRGKRTFGNGTHKNRRGGGSRGGRGNAGTCKHHFVRSMQRGLLFGKHGFKRPLAIVDDCTIVNVGEIDEAIEQLVADGVAEMKGDAFHIDLANLGIEKVLGSGKVTKPLFITASEFSSTAKQKIDEAKGKAVEPAEEAAETTETPKPE
ncbi:uL15m family ribosomal protein [Candidatus Methanoperedens nitratireducens]|uniref:Large ribosomal subunit protein uL15 n=1 Tax=Candidatus Methanoperedens nitratireducens TaxID=1392998 RepID=A0A284VNA3_9EURY|nr:uL15 family ribosomal protein [Candidatus Methanoperedens nitroreducens]SNQ60689.1 50S ribosomal protein L15P [Candidatus Methanoperedens nitroreducens]